MTTCARCGTSLHGFHAEVRLHEAVADGLALFGPDTPIHEVASWCESCLTRVRVALDWALGGDGGFDAAYIERLESVCCAVKFDEGTQEWSRQHPLDNFFNIPPANYRLWTSPHIDTPFDAGFVSDTGHTVTPAQRESYRLTGANPTKNPLPQSQRFNR